MSIPSEHHSKTARLGTACCSVRIDKSEPCKVRGICQSPASIIVKPLA
ncbi:hypothetical protein QUF80_14805 [Desulfococcaceae bacterium HSG8]|nr:hypothetical protein [Desulfococcaceae bacterium HSG8]